MWCMEIQKITCSHLSSIKFLSPAPCSIIVSSIEIVTYSNKSYDQNTQRKLSRCFVMHFYVTDLLSSAKHFNLNVLKIKAMIFSDYLGIGTC